MKKYNYISDVASLRISTDRGNTFIMLPNGEDGEHKFFVFDDEKQFEEYLHFSKKEKKYKKIDEYYLTLTTCQQCMIINVYDHDCDSDDELYTTLTINFKYKSSLKFAYVIQFTESNDDIIYGFVLNY